MKSGKLGGMRILHPSFPRDRQVIGKGFSPNAISPFSRKSRGRCWSGGGMRATSTGNILPMAINKLAYWGRIVFVIVFILVHFFAIQNMILLSRDLLLGDHSAEKIKPLPQYGFIRIPRTQWTK